ncbi:Peptidoglycan/LPS O-acetylase OafA/YrhL, contains acyltransferase and SGNH-hydrolase domains [Flavobacterium swingsii]|uniref:Peptidoglycan/LPS O-acetylase OafA/YrhL, contains acyltransferase and SGNH-hydrolase domains n=1 Tax=Flavobacterium swingsii TaxID=498292 RepID=A0A1I0VE18_9FLAO|nr:acyltransferase [Flavobacterium swingsii]SFA74478.1 Peptidoglycan/LPS O-acetylase OafA/YrhL, contains acyltransferase and SGNH-hydrolase domains [Flavobacterium swingsii]
MNALEKQNNTRIFGLDVIRALAILLVLFSHVYYLIDSINPLVISLSGLSGFTGVELFFVLSGYLIGSILLRQYITDDFSLQSIFVFLKRRWFRTLPNYYLILFVNLGIAFLLGYPSQYWYKYFFFFQNFKTYSIGFFSESWSLSVEEWTYILLPFSLFLALKFGNKLSRKWTFLATILLLIVLAHIFRYFNMKNSDISTMEIWNTNLKSIVIYRFDTILYGVLLAWLYQFYAHFLDKYKTYFLILAVHLFVLQFIILNVLGVDIISCPTYFKVFYFTLSSMIFFLVLPYFVFWKTSQSVFSTSVTFISKTSYAVYLIHYSIVVVLFKYVLSQLYYQLPTSLVLFIYFGITFSLSYILYRFFEKPIMNLRDKN